MNLPAQENDFLSSLQTVNGPLLVFTDGSAIDTDTEKMDTEHMLPHSYPDN
jgi:hypothetical protein